MRRIAWRRLIVILLAVVVAAAAVSVQSFDLRFLGLHLQRGSDSILGMRLGLDLQGGVHLLYQARGKKEVAITFQDPVTVDAVRAVMGDLGKSDAVVQSTGERTLTVRVNTLKQEQRDEQGIVTQPEELETIREALEQHVGQITALQTSDIPAVVTPDQMEGVLNIITKRINPVGIAEPVIQLMDSNRILVQLPGVKDVEEVKQLIGQTARLEFKERTCLADGITVLPNGEPGNLCDLPENHLDKEVNLTGDDLARAFAGTDPQTGQPIINVQFNSRGAEIFAEMSTRLAGTAHRFAVFLDEEEIMAPVFRQPILGGSAVVSGTFTAERVRTISIQLESGRLPIPIAVVQESSVDATLGAESLRKSLIAGMAGLGLVLLFIVMYYKAPGLVAVMALVMYTVVLLAIFKLVPITLTLAGIAAFILSIGMAVDANVLIFERMKEELRLGRTLASAIEIGFNRAWPSIRDSNTSTLITCLILFWFGQRLGASLVAGFASALAIGVVLSMFSAIAVSKTILNLFSISPLGNRRSWFTPEPLPAALRTASTGVTRGKE